MKQLPVNKKIRFKTEYVREDGYLGTGFKFGEYYIKYLNNGQENACSWQYLKRKRTVGLFLNRTYNLGYVDTVKISVGKDKLDDVKCKIYHKPPEYDELDDTFGLGPQEEEGWYQTKRPEIVKGKSNSVTLSGDNGDKKLLFFNSSDQKNTKLVISKGDKLIFQRDI